MNEDLIRKLELERNLLYPNGFVIPPRGSSKTFMILNRNIHYMAYDWIYELYKDIDEEKTIEDAHNDMATLIKMLYDIYFGGDN